MTNRETDFVAQAEITQKGPHTGEKVIRFMQDNKEYARAYECCWGHYYNCNRTRIGMYCAALMLLLYSNFNICSWIISELPIKKDIP